MENEEVFDRELFQKIGLSLIGALDEFEGVDQMYIAQNLGFLFASTVYDICNTKYEAIGYVTKTTCDFLDEIENRETKEETQ